MQRSVSARMGMVCAIVAAAISWLAAPVSAQTTKVLPAVTHGTVRAGAYAGTLQGDLIATRASDTADYLRRGMLKFDTENEIPAGANVTSATLTLSVTYANDSTRHIGAYQVTQSFGDNDFTWTYRRKSETLRWLSSGGDLGTRLDVQTVGSTVGAKVSFDVTSLVKEAVSGALGSSRYTRVALVDLDASSRSSYREYGTPTNPNASLRPTLTVTYGGSSTTSSTSSTSGTTLRVLQWNTHHGGYRTDGVWDPNLLISWVAKIKPDIVSMNEVEYYTSWGNTDDPALFKSLLEQKTGQTWYTLFAQNSGNWTAHGNGDLILSRYPFVGTAKHALSYTRAVAEVQISVNGRIVNVASTHLDASSTSYRLTEISQLKSWFGGFAEQRIVAGDFNAWPGSSENSAMTQSYYDSWAVAQSNGTAVSYPGNPDGYTRNSRIDYVYYSHGATLLTLKSSQVFDTRDANGVMPSDHRPLLSVFTVH